MLRGCISCYGETDMTIWEISEKADYIADRHRQQQEQWHIYCNSLVQGITLSKARLHHAMSCAPDKELCFVLFGHFQVYVALAEGFNSHTIEYYVESKNGDDKRLIAQATLDAELTVASVTVPAKRCWNTTWRSSPPSMTACMRPWSATSRWI